MATTVFAATDPAVVWAGQYFDGIAGNVSPYTRSRNFQGLRSGFDFTATGTDLTWRVLVQTTGQTVTVSVDGGAATSLTMPASANTWTDVTLFSGLSDTAHTVRVRCTGVAPNYIGTDLESAFSLTGAAPALSLTSGFGPVLPIYGPLARYAVSVEGNYLPSIVDGYAYPEVAVAGTSTMSKLRFRAKAETISLWTSNVGQRYRVYRDGVLYGAMVTAPNTSTREWVTLATGLDPADEREYTVMTLAGTFSDYALMVSGDGAEFNLSPANLYPDRDVLLVVGDSIAQTAARTDNSDGWANLLALSKGYHLINRAVSGTGAISWLNVNATGMLQRVQDYRIFGARPPAVVILEHGFADASQPLNQTAFYETVLATIRSLLAAFPGVKILVPGIFPTTGVSSGNRTAFNAQKEAAVTAAASPDVTYLDTDGVIVTGTDTTDGIHPNAAGDAKIATFFEGYVETADRYLVPDNAAIAAIKEVTDKLDDLLQSDGSGGYEFTSAALENATVDLSGVEASLDRLLGLSQENWVLRSPAFDADGNLETATVRLYDSAAHAETDDGSTGIVAVYAIENTYTDGVLTKSTQTRVS